MGMSFKKVKTYFSKGILRTAGVISLYTFQKAKKNVSIKNISYLEQNKQFYYEIEARKNRIKATYNKLPPR